MILPVNVQAPALSQQPTTIEITEYQRVQRPLADGTPDPGAPDNFYIRIRYDWLLLLDSDRVAPDADGTRRLHMDGFKTTDRVEYRQEGRPSKALEERFTEVRPLLKGKSSMETGGSTTRTDFDLDVPKGQRHVDYYIRALVEKVETHTEGKRRVTRTTREAHWSIYGGGGRTGEVVVPQLESTAIFEPGSHVRPLAPRYGYGPVSIPKWDAF